MDKVAVPMPGGVSVTNQLTREKSNEVKSDHSMRLKDPFAGATESDAMSSPPTIPAPILISTPEYPTPLPLAVILVSLMLAIFPVALDMVCTPYSPLVHH